MATSVTKIKIDRRKFYQNVRQSFFAGKISQMQVDGMDHILNEWENRALTDLRWLSYILATVYHETAKTMQPIEEYGKGKGRAYGRPVNGRIYYGRGFCQLTWPKNYKMFSDLLHIDLLNHPELALDCTVAGHILFEGMIKGLFTGKKLADYFDDKILVDHEENEKKWFNARRIINGIDCAELISVYGKRFYAALN